MNVRGEIDDSNHLNVIIDKDSASLSEIKSFRTYLFSSVKYSGRVLCCIGFAVNNTGSNNPLLMVNGLATETYIMIKHIIDSSFILDPDSPRYNLNFEKCDVDILRVTVETSEPYMSFSYLKSELAKAGIIFNTVATDECFFNSINNSNELTLLFKLLPENTGVDELKFKHKLDNYYLVNNDYHMTYSVAFNKQEYVIKFRQLLNKPLELFTDIYEEYKEYVKL